MRYALGLVVLVAIGCASGEKNYKELDRDAGDPFETERDPLFRGTAAPMEGVEVVRADEPSVRGLDRSHWPTIRFTAAKGVDGGRYLPPESPYAGAEPPQRFDAALGGARPGNWSAGNVGAAVLEPVWIARDVVTMPVRAARGAATGRGAEAGASSSGGGLAAPRSPAGP